MRLKQSHAKENTKEWAMRDISGRGGALGCGYFKCVQALEDYRLIVTMETGAVIHFDFSSRLEHRALWKAARPRSCSRAHPRTASRSCSVNPAW